MDIVQLGYKELRIVSSHGWSVPIHCDPYTNDGKTVTHWKIKPALELLSGPWQELSNVFAPVSLSESKSYWIIPDDLVSQLTKKVTGCIPGDYLKWTSHEPTAESAQFEVVRQEFEKDEPFLRFLCRSAGMDFVLGRYFWASMRKAIVEWLVNEQKPISFGPFTIHPVPLRENWKEIMLSKHPGSIGAFKNEKFLNRLKNDLLKMGFLQDMGSTDLTAMSRYGFIWNYELELSDELLKASRDAESERLSLKKPARYAKYYESCIRKKLDSMLGLYRLWLQKIRQPVAELHESPVSGSPVLRSRNKGCQVLPERHRPYAAVFQPSEEVVHLRPGQRLARPVEGKIADLLEMPVVQQGIEDVRECEGADVDTGRNGHEADGVLLLHAAQVETARGDVLAQGAGI